MSAKVHLIILLLALAPSASGHDFWMEPERYRVTPGASVAVSLRVGERFVGDPVPRINDWFERFSAIDPEGEERHMEGTIGDEPAGTVTLHKPGLHALVYVSTSAYAEMGITKFLQYAQDEGVDHILRRELALQEGGNPPVAREVFYRFAKSLVAVDPIAAGVKHHALEPVGLRFEIIPQQDVIQGCAGECGFVVRFDGTPLADALLVARSKSAPDQPLSVRTDAQGIGRIPLNATGEWLIKAVHLTPAPPGSGITQWLSFWAALTFAVQE